MQIKTHLDATFNTHLQQWKEICHIYLHLITFIIMISAKLGYRLVYLIYIGENHASKWFLSLYYCGLKKKLQHLIWMVRGSDKPSSPVVDISFRVRWRVLAQELRLKNMGQIFKFWFQIWNQREKLFLEKNYTQARYKKYIYIGCVR